MVKQFKIDYVYERISKTEIILQHLVASQFVIKFMVIQYYSKNKMIRDIKWKCKNIMHTHNYITRSPLWHDPRMEWMAVDHCCHGYWEASCEMLVAKVCQEAVGLGTTYIRGLNGHQDR